MKRFCIAATALLGLPLAACAHAMAEKAPTQTLRSYILLDRTGSMSNIWEEALVSVNTYAENVSKGAPGERLDTRVTLAIFDAQDGFQFDVLRDDVPADEWRPVTNDEASPRGMTPLFDAIGQVISLAEGDDAGKAVIVIMTDGEENASRELTRDGVAAALKRAEERGWEVVFLGAEFANFADAENVGVGASKTMAVSKDAMAPVMQDLAKKSRAYATEQSAPVEFNEEDRARAEEEDVKQRKGGNQ